MDGKELHSFARNVRDDLDLAGAFADWLEDRGDPRGVLLRRRWKRWRSERDYATELDGYYAKRLTEHYSRLIDTVRSLGGTATIEVAITTHRDRADASFRRYVASRFLPPPF